MARGTRVRLALSGVEVVLVAYLGHEHWLCEVDGMLKDLWQGWFVIRSEGGVR